MPFGSKDDPLCRALRVLEFYIYRNRIKIRDMHVFQSYGGGVETNQRKLGFCCRWLRCLGHESHGATSKGRRLAVVVLRRTPLARAAAVEGEPGFAPEIGLMGKWNLIGRCRSGAPASRRITRRDLGLGPPPAGQGSAEPKAPSPRRRTIRMGRTRSAGCADGSRRAATRAEGLSLGAAVAGHRDG
jgi:hypothetical protein